MNLFSPTRWSRAVAAFVQDPDESLDSRIERRADELEEELINKQMEQIHNETTILRVERQGELLRQWLRTRELEVTGDVSPIRVVFNDQTGVQGEQDVIR